MCEPAGDTQGRERAIPREIRATGTVTEEVHNFGEEKKERFKRAINRLRFTRKKELKARGATQTIRTGGESMNVCCKLSTRGIPILAGGYGRCRASQRVRFVRVARI